MTLLRPPSAPTEPWDWREAPVSTLPAPSPLLPEPLDGAPTGPLRQPLRQRVRAWAALHKASLGIVGSLMGVVGVVHGIGMYRSPMPVDDEGTYMAEAWSVQVHHAITPYTYWYDHPPLGWFQIAGWTWITHGFRASLLAIDAGRQFMLVCALVGVALLYLIARRLELSRAWSSVVVLLWALSPLAITYQRMVYLDNIAMVWLLAAFALALTPRRSLWAYSASGACLAMSVLSKETMLLFVPALIYMVWQRSDRTTRSFCVTAQIAVFLLVGIGYPLFALLRGELLPGHGHVSLWSAIEFQLWGRQGSGSPFTSTSQAHALVSQWLHLDPWLPIAGVVCIPVGLALRRFRPIAVAELAALLSVVHGGYLPVPFVICLLPFAALLIVATCAWATGRAWWPTEHRHEARWALRAGLLMGVAGSLLLEVVPAWASGIESQMTSNDMAPTVAAEHWVEAHVPRHDRLLTDDTVWVDLVDHGFDKPLGVVWFNKLGYVDQLDPSVARKLPGGWRDFQYVISTPSMREALTGSSGQLPQVADALSHSTPVASFGPASEQVVIRRMDTASPVPAVGPTTTSSTTSSTTQRG